MACNRIKHRRLVAIVGGAMPPDVNKQAKDLEGTFSINILRTLATGSRLLEILGGFDTQTPYEGHQRIIAG